MTVLQGLHRDIPEFDAHVLQVVARQDWLVKLPVRRKGKKGGPSESGKRREVQITPQPRKMPVVA